MQQCRCLRETTRLTRSQEEQAHGCKYQHAIQRDGIRGVPVWWVGMDGGWARKLQGKVDILVVAGVEES